MLNRVGNPLFQGKSRSKLNIAYTVLTFIVIAMCCFMIAFSSVYKGIYIVESSMYPTLNGAVRDGVKGGDYVYVNTLKKPDYGDIVVVYSKTVQGRLLIKRAVAFGGDRIKLVGGQLYIMYGGEGEFVLVAEDYVSESCNSPDKENNSYPVTDGEVAEEGHLVEEGCMFLLGDNRNVSNDSREYGDFNIDLLFGVMPKWAYSGKFASTAVHNFFAFDLPSLFGA